MSDNSLQFLLPKGLPAAPDDVKAGSTVLVGLSGGVDSALTALTLKSWNLNVLAVRMKIYRGPSISNNLSYGCYGRDSAEESAQAALWADMLGIDFMEIDCSEPYEQLVINYFRDEYRSGRTPNPCVYCNEKLKFHLLPQLAAQRGFECDYFATGHYVQKCYLPQYGRYAILKGVDPRKDQSYFLYRLSQEQLRRSLFPLGSLTKNQVRLLAAEASIPMHNKPDSQDFYGGDYGDILQFPAKVGEIVDTQGRVLGRHKGYWNYTPGQRKGLGISSSAPLYVLHLDAARNQVVVGHTEENHFKGCLIGDNNFMLPLPEEGTRLNGRIRSSQSPQPMVVGKTLKNGQLEVYFTPELSGLAPGQSLVLYDGDILIGGGIIIKSL